MHRTRAFFYVCAGLFLLALSYHLGARNAGAQGGDLIQVGGIGLRDGHNTYAAVVGRTLWRHYGSDPFSSPYPYPIPGTSAVVAVNHTQGAVILANGDVYETGQFAPDGWAFKMNLLDGPTPARQESFGAVKSRYRGERGATQPAQDR